MPPYGTAPVEHFGPTRTQQVLILVTMLLAAMCGQLLALTWLDSDRFLLAPQAVGILLAAALCWPSLRRQGLTVEPSGLAHRRGAFVRRVPWDEVQAVEVRRGRGGSACLVVHRRSGRPLRPLYPRHRLLAPDPDFERKAAIVRACHDTARPAT